MSNTNVIFYMLNNGEEFFTPDYEGKTIRQLFEAGISKGILGNIDFGNVALSINNQQIAGLDSFASDVVARVLEGRSDTPETLTIYVSAVGRTGTKAAWTLDKARALMNELENNGWELTEIDPEAGIFTFEDNGGDEHEIVVTPQDLFQYAEVGSAKLVAAIKLHESQNGGSGASPAVQASTSPDASSSSLQAQAEALRIATAELNGVPEDRVKIQVNILM